MRACRFSTVISLFLLRDYGAFRQLHASQTSALETLCLEMVVEYILDDM